MQCRERCAGGRARQVAELFLGDAISETEGETRSSPEMLEPFTGLYRDTRTNQSIRVTVSDGALHVFGVALYPVSATRFEAWDGVALDFESAPSADHRTAALFETPVASAVRIEPVNAYDPSAEQLEAFLGRYHSPEAEATWEISVEDGKLVISERYGDPRTLRPVFNDAFQGPHGTFVFVRDQSGAVTQLRLSQGRVWDLRSDRQP